MVSWQHTALRFCMWDHNVTIFSKNHKLKILICLVCFKFNDFSLPVQYNQHNSHAQHWHQHHGQHHAIHNDVLFFFIFFTLFFLTRLFAGNVANPTGCENNGPFWAGHFPRWAGQPDPPRPTHDGGVCVKVTRDQQVKRERGKKWSESLPVGRNNMAESSGAGSGRLKKKGQRHKRRAERKRCTGESRRH